MMRARQCYRECIAVVLLVVCVSNAAQAQHGSHAPIDTHHIPEARIAAINVGLTSALAVARGVVTGEVRSVRSAGRHALYGAGSGLAFYQAKRMVGQGHEWTGIALAYGTMSVLRNVGTGEHPLGTLCAGPGPLDFCVRTGLDPSSDFGLRTEVNALASVSTVVMLVTGNMPEFRAGTLHFRSRQPLGFDDGFIRTGYALGRTIMLAPHAGDGTWQHELIHYVQALQIASVAPGYTARGLMQLLAGTEMSRDVHRARSWDVQIDWLLMGVGAINSFIPYERQWNEIEAYRLTTDPPDPPFVMFPRY
jgi:hypothetical protein